MRSRYAFTLVELVISLAISTILLAGMTSALFLATRGIPGETRPVEQIINETQVATDLVSELACACNILERGTRAVAFTVADRNADGSPEYIRYAWSGTSGDPLTRQVNRGAVVSVLSDVREFALTYDTTSVVEEYDGPPVESAETLMSSRSSASWSQDFTLKDKAWIGQYFSPSLPSAAVTWKVTRVQVRAHDHSSLNGTIGVQLRPAQSTGAPEAQVLDQTLLAESKLLASSSSYRWEEIAFANAGGLTPGTGLCLVLVRNVTDAELGDLIYDRQGYGDLLYTNDGGSTWTCHSTYTLLHYIYGTYTTPGAKQSATRNYITNVRAGLRAGSTSGDRVDTAARTINVPEIVSGVWESEFSSNPTTLDLNGDGSADWAAESGSFDGTRVSGGLWKANSNLVSSPANNFTQLTTVELAFRATTTGGTAAFRINADCTGGNYVPLYAGLTLTSEGGQTLTVACKPSSGTATTLLVVPNLPSALVALRLVIDPALNTVSVEANGTHCGTFTYALSADTGVNRVASLIASGTTAEFDYVRIRVKG